MAGEALAEGTRDSYFTSSSLDSSLRKMGIVWAGRDSDSLLSWMVKRRKLESLCPALR